MIIKVVRMHEIRFYRSAWNYHSMDYKIIGLRFRIQLILIESLNRFTKAALIKQIDVSIKRLRVLLHRICANYAFQI